MNIEHLHPQEVSNRITSTIVVEAIVVLETNEEDKPLEDIPLDVNIIYMTESEISMYGFDLPN